MVSNCIGGLRFYAKSLFAWNKAKFFTRLSRSNRNRNYQRLALSRLLNFAKKNVPYYRTLIPDKVTPQSSFEVLLSMPLLSKQQIREAGAQIYSDEVTRGGIESWTYWHNTGGSTGSPLKFPLKYSSKIELELTHQALIYQKMGVSLFDRISSVDGRRVEESDLSNHVYWGENEYNFPYGKYHYSTMYLEESTAHYYIEHLKKYPPKVLRGYPSGILTLCKFIEREEPFLDLKLKGVYITSENSSQDDCDYISNILNCPVWGQYGHSEMSIFAVRYPKSESYYCSPFYGVTEILDKYGNPVKVGETGEVVVSGFQNYALPFIRYKTGDLAQYGGMEADGTVILSCLQGRDTDYIIDIDGNRIYLVGFIFGGHLSAFNHIIHWQIEQSKFGELTLRIVPASSYDKSIEQELIEFFMKKKISISIDYCDAIPKTNRGKQKFLIQHLL